MLSRTARVSATSLVEGIVELSELLLGSRFNSLNLPAKSSVMTFLGLLVCEWLIGFGM